MQITAASGANTRASPCVIMAASSRAPKMERQAPQDSVKGLVEVQTYHCLTSRVAHLVAMLDRRQAHSPILGVAAKTENFGTLVPRAVMCKCNDYRS
eukprot:6205725-Pleurochrysis_carterae.AAC.6